LLRTWLTVCLLFLLMLVGSAAQSKKMPKSTEPPVELPSGLKYWNVKVGTGLRAINGSRCAVHYTGWLKSGRKFDSSYDAGKPYAFEIGKHQVIKGWEEGVRGMRVGGKRILQVPSELGYGSQNMGEGTIPPNSILVFEIELLAVD
jgi:FKBP-type peptidyl-prolyl cis-trans isomerase FkpA